MALRRAITQHRFDIIHVNGSSDHRTVMLATMGMVRRPAIVFTKHNDFSLHSMGHGLRARFGTDSVIAVSAYVAGLLQASPYRHLPIVTISHGIDTDYFAPQSDALLAGLRERYFGPSTTDKILLGSVAGTYDEKGWFDLLKGIALLPPPARQRFRILVAGKLPDEAKMMQVRQLGLRDQVVFPGFLDDVRPVLAACDVGFVLSYREALSFACREVMSLGLPALVSDAGGLPENVNHGQDGWIVPVCNPPAIARVLHAILQDPGRIRIMGASARAKSERNFGLARFITDTEAVYDAVFKLRCNAGVAC
jgi:glycosyltransferase involved in cell wall biosynthesis